MDYASIIQGGMNLVPNLRDQLVQDALMKQREEAFQWERDDRAAQRQAATQGAQRQAEFQAALEDAMMSGDPRKILNLRMRYPEMAKGMKEAFDALDEDTRRTNLTQIGTIFARGNAGDFKGAADIMRARVEADRAAGMADPMDEQILAGLESDDPVQQRSALATAGIMLSSVNPEKFGEVYGKLNPTEATPATMREYDARVAKFGRAAADAWLQTQDTKVIPVTQGGTVFQIGGDTIPQGNAPATQGGGDPSGSGAGMPPGSFWSYFDLDGEQGAVARSQSQPVQVRSQQDAIALPRGTHFIDPRDGVTVRVRP